MAPAASPPEVVIQKHHLYCKQGQFLLAHGLWIKWFPISECVALHGRTMRLHLYRKKDKFLLAHGSLVVPSKGVLPFMAHRRPATPLLTSTSPVLDG